MQKLHGLIATMAVLASVSPLAAQPVLLFGHSGIPNGIPNPCATPTISSVQSGRWDQPSTWSGNRVPQGGDRVMVAAGTSVQYTTVTDVKPTCVNINGALRFSTTTSTRLRVGTLIVLEDGTLEIGTPAQPVAAGATAELFLAGLPFDSADPEQFWGGLIGIGRVTMHGAPLAPTFARLAAEPTSGQNTVTLAAPVAGWRVGDEIVVPDTRSLAENQRFSGLSAQDERARITAINGQSLTLDRAWAFTHPGARDAGGTVRIYPHAGNVSRNVKILSDAPGGVRGHTMYTHRAQVDLRYVELRDLGRTTNAALAPTTNQLGRYPLHIHHLMGPVNAANSGYQFQLVGNAMVDGRKWPLTVHNSHYGLIRDNVVAFGLGAGYVTEDGNESENEFARNFGMAITGDANPRDQDGRAGSVFWFNGFNHILTDNVAAAGHNHTQGIVAGSGFDFSQPAAPQINTKVPRYRGADLMQSGTYQLVNMQEVPIRRFERNEAYGAMAIGLVIWNLGTDGYKYVQGMGETLIRDFASWNCYEGAIYGYPINHVTVDGLTWYGTALRSRAWSTGDYKARDITIRNFTIVGGEAMGIDVSMGSEGTFRIENGTIQSTGGSDANIYISRLNTPGTGATVRARRVEIVNVRFQPWPGRSVTNLRKDWGGSNQPASTPDEAFVYAYNGNSSDNFQWYYSVQDTQNVAGGLAPCQTTRAGIIGIVCPTGAAPPSSPSPPPTSAPLPAPPPSTSPTLTLTCPSNQAVTSENGQPVVVTFPAAQASGGTPPITVTASPASGTTFPVGTTTVTVIALDTSQKASCSFTVTVTSQSSTTVTVTSVTELHSAIDALTSGRTISIRPGTYRLTRALRIRNGVTNVTVKGSTGNRLDVVILGTGMTAPGVDVGFQIENAQDVTISDLSVGQFYGNSILLQGPAGADRIRIRNVRLYDAGQQFIKSTVNEQIPNGVDDVLVEGSLIEYTSIGPSTGAIEGIQVNFGTRWSIRQNVFRNIHVPAGAANTRRAAILMWSGSQDTDVSANTFIDCERAVAFGLGPQTGYSHAHSGGTIVNNNIYRTQPVNADAGILVWDSPGTRVLHNTVIQNGTFPTAIDYRFNGSTGLEIMNNLTDGAIDRNSGAQGTTAGNYTGATPGLFVDAAAADLHLRGGATVAIDRGVVVNGVPVDWDGQSRPRGPLPDIGADEYGQSPSGGLPEIGGDESGK